MKQEICVVSYGGVFPEAKNPAELFSNLMAGKQSIHDFRIPPSRDAFYQNLPHFYNTDKKATNRSYSPMGAFLDRRWTTEFSQKNGLNADNFSSAEIFAIEAAAQTLEPLKNKIPIQNIEIIVGATSIDLEYMGHLKLELLEEKLGVTEKDPAYQELKKTLHKIHIPKERYTCATSLLNTLKKHFGIKGLGMLTDAACASSFSAVYVAQQRLRSGAAEFVLSGGLEENLAPFLEVLFAKAGVLSEKTICPFDVRSKGMNHGEAFAFLALCTKETAEKYKLPICGVIENCQGSSDGLRGGATEPTMEGQILAYNRVYANGQAPKLHYIEAHGTGTTVGDKTEIQSLDRFFGQKIPVGSVKSNIGHTIGAAGAASIIKCLEIIKHKTVPPSKYFEGFPNTFNTNLYVNKEPVKLPNENIQIAISSFGFGGTNFHMFLREKPVANSAAASAPCKKSFVLCATEEVRFEQIQNYLNRSKVRIPPKTIPHFDPMVLSGILALEQIINKHAINFSAEEKKKIATLSCGSLSLDNTWLLNDCLALDELADYFKGKQIEEKIQRLIQSLPEFTADTGPSVLNNLIAGRSSKMFDFQGPNFHIDADLLSRATAYLVGEHILQDEETCVFILSAIETYNKERNRFDRKGLRVDLIATPEYAEKNDLPVLSQLKEIILEG